MAENFTETIFNGFWKHIVCDHNSGVSDRGKLFCQELKLCATSLRSVID